VRRAPTSNSDFPQGRRPARNPPCPPEAVKKPGSVFFLSFRRKPESNISEALNISWTPVFTGVTNKRQFFHSFALLKGVFGGGFQRRFERKVLVSRRARMGRRWKENTFLPGEKYKISPIGKHRAAW